MKKPTIIVVELQKGESSLYSVFIHSENFHKSVESINDIVEKNIEKYQDAEKLIVELRETESSEALVSIELPANTKFPISEIVALLEEKLKEKDEKN